MKRRLLSPIRLSLALTSAMAALLAALPAPAVTYYWDNNGTTAGFGTAAGLWEGPTTGSATQGWSTASGGLALPGNVTTTTADTLNLGFNGLGLALGTITVNGTVDAGNLTLASSSGAITLTGGTINLADNSTFTLTGNQVNLSSGAITNTLTIGSTLTGAGTSLTQTGTGMLNLTAANTYTGRTIINGGGVSANFNVISTVGGIALSGNGTIAASSGLTLNNGGLTLTNTNAAEALLDRVSNAAGITSNGGTITFTNPSGGDIFAEALGLLSLNGGQTNFVLTNDQVGAGSQTLTLGGLTRTGTAAATFSSGGGGLNATKNIIAVTGASATPAGQIIGPWATTGISINSLTDYAVFNPLGQVVPAAIAASAESSWLNSTDAYTRNSAGTATRLTATRNITALRSINTALAATVATSDIITVTGSTFLNGDPVAFSYSNLGGIPGGLAHFTTYYVRDVSGTTFKVAATPDGPAIDITSTGSGVAVSAGMLLPAGNNLGTLSILGGGTGHQLIAGPGAVTLPSTTSDNLTVTAGLNVFNGAMPSSAVIISAPITDNGAGVLTLVKNGAGNLALSGTNTFTGGIVVNAGNLIWTTDANLGAANAPVTFNASSGLSSIVASTSNRPFILNPGVMVSIASGGSGTVTLDGPVQGSGGISLFHGNSGTATGNLNSTANTFTGPVRFQGTNVNLNLNINSLADPVGAGNIIFGYVNGGALTMTFNYGAGATAPMTLNNRQFELGAGPQLLQTISNSSPQALTINSNLLVTGTTGRVLTLGGTGVGLSTFAGTISDSANATTGSTPLAVAYNTATSISSVTLASVTGITVGATISGNGLPLSTVTAVNPLTRVVSFAPVTTTLAGVFNQSMTVAGVINSVSLAKAGTGTWVLSGNNNYTGATTVTAGVLRLDGANALPGGLAATGGTSLLILNGGVVGLGAGDFARGIGTGPSQFQFTASGGGFAAYGAARSVTPGSLAWGTTVGTQIVGPLLLGAANSDATVTWASDIDLGTSARTIQVADGSAAVDAIVSGQFAATTGGLTKTGAGTLSLTNTNLYTGPTAVSAGRLVVSGSISASSLTTVASTATLAGGGTVGALTVAAGGFVGPGSSPGTLTVMGNYTQAGQYTVEIAGTTPGTEFDRISVTGSVNITGGSLVPQFSASPGYTMGTQLFILLNDGVDPITGTYAGFSQDATVANFGGFDWQISYNADSDNNTSTGGNDIALMAVPEPTLATLLGGFSLLTLLPRRRNRA